MEINKAKFYRIIYDSTLKSHERFNIGTYKEKTLHIVLKKYFEEDVNYHEINVGGFIADILRDGVITEIQTSSLTGLKPKLEKYLDEYKVQLVYPLASVKYISWIDPESGSVSKRHKTSKKTSVYNAISEAVRILPYINNNNLCIIVPMLEIDEYRMLDGWSRDKKRGSNRYERIPTDIFDILELNTVEDYAKYLPDDLEDNFTVTDFKKRVSVDEKTARCVIRVFIEKKIIEKGGKKGNSILYKRVQI